SGRAGRAGRGRQDPGRTAIRGGEASWLLGRKEGFRWRADPVTAGEEPKGANPGVFDLQRPLEVWHAFGKAAARKITTPVVACFLNFCEAKLFLATNEIHSPPKRGTRPPRRALLR